MDKQTQRSRLLAQKSSAKVRMMLCALVVAIASPAFTQLTPSSFSLRQSSAPKTLSLHDVLTQAKNQHRDVVIAKEQLQQEQSRLGRSYALYLPKLVLDGTLTFNFPEIKASLSNKAQALQQAQVLNSLSDLLELTGGLRDPVGLENALARATLFKQSALDLESSKSSSVVIQPATLFEAKLTLTQPIFNMESIQTIRSSELTQKRSQKAFERTQSAAFVEVARAYLQALRAKRLIQAARNRVTRADGQLARMKDKYALGLARMADIKRLQVEQANAKEQLVQANIKSNFALGELGILIGQEETFDVNDSLEQYTLGNEEADDLQVEQALSSREDLRAQELAVRSSKQAEESINAGFYPTLNLVGQGAYTSNTSGFINKPFRGAILLQASISLFDGGDRYARLQENHSKIREEKIRLKDLERRIDAEIRGKLADIAAKKSALAAAQQTLRLQRSILDDAQSNFTSGLLETLDLIDANQKLSDAEINVENAKLDLSLAHVELKFAKGDLRL